MSTTTVCLTLSTLTQTIEEILKDYPEPFHQAFFNHSKDRQKLMTRILSYLPNCSLSKNPGTLCYSLQQGMYLEDLVRQSIAQVYLENADWINTLVELTSGISAVSS